jgi:site-specific DNA recombinase
VIHRVDRLSRSLLDFAKLMEAFEKQHVAFASVTQHFHSGTSMGRLVLNVLLSFAQFERELIAERTRDKVAAARRKGKWSGGLPILGYDVDAPTKMLVVNEAEAARVRAIFALYLEYQSLLPVVEELARRGWCTKRTATRQGRVRGGRPFTKGSLYQLLTNVTYVGQIRYRKEVHPGEQPAIVDRAVWQRVQARLAENGRARWVEQRSRSRALLQGLLRCRPCGCAMTPAHVTHGNKRYRYYTCSAAQKKGWNTCPSKSVPAQALERYVLEHVAPHARDVDWATLTPCERAERLRQLVTRIDYDGTNQHVAITLQSNCPPGEKAP